MAAAVTMPAIPANVAEWIAAFARLTGPARVHFCDGSEAEFDMLAARLVAEGKLIPLNPDTHPRCFLHRSHPDDVARVEHLTFVCTRERDEAGPNNQWLPPEQAHARMRELFSGCMRGRTLYVVPYVMGPPDSPYSRLGIELTDSAYVVLNLHRMTRVLPDRVYSRIAGGEPFVRGLHSVGELDPNRRFIMHYPEELAIESYGSGYGGNALLAKKCHALRIASWQARQEGWLAEHMLILRIETSEGEPYHIAAAFPSACGKTNLAMLVPPPAYRAAGWRVSTIGDDIAWLHPGADGRLWAINPEAGFFGVVPGTSRATNPNAMAMLGEDVIFTNVGLTADGQPWWEGLSEGVPAYDWQGRPWRREMGPAAHPNARFTVRASRCPSYSPLAESPAGVPIDAIVFGGRRADLVPLVMQAQDWTQGVLLGAAMASETTAAASGATGVLRRDPMAMQPFCGYHFGDYFEHWLRIGASLRSPPGVFLVNWFRRGTDGGFLWPGFGENIRVLEWIVRRVRGEVGAWDGVVGWLPEEGDLRLEGLALDGSTLSRLLEVDREGWAAELADIGRFLDGFEPRLPERLRERLRALKRALAG
ncbi:MAG: phosphoenolpyruvate carboxykinase [GTP] [Lysobacterales bacterium]|jgi:phosphoenolpyruvate carboxykinase (GTP)|nr:MAG: phosphoenolpyruvate carboxykinase [GTP] [Xanthomonadales bacterium]